MINYASVCSGVEAASLAWHSLGWKPVWFSEIEPFPCAVLKERFPNVPNLGDMTKIKIEKDNNNETEFTGLGTDVPIRHNIDLLVGGTPCQDLSVAGKRAGFAGERSSLALDYVRIAYESGCRWIVWENVPGTFSSAGGRDFATFLSILSGRQVEVPQDGWSNSGFVQNLRVDRYGLAWRVLDAQFTTVSMFPHAIPQRRNRLFVVGYFGDWVRAAQVLLEPERLQWNTPTRKKTRKTVTEIIGTNAQMSSGELCINKEYGTESAQVLRMRQGKEGGGKGALVSNECSLTLQTGNDQTMFSFEKADGFNFEMYSGECKETFASSSYGDYAAAAAAGTLKANGGDIGGGSENLATFWNGDDVTTTLTEAFADDRMPDKDKLPCVVEYQKTPSVIGYNGSGLESGDVIPTLQANLEKLLSNQTPLICYASGGFGNKVESEVASTLSTDHDDRVTGNNAALIQECYDNRRISEIEKQKYYNWHSPNHSAKEINDDCAPTIPAAMGMGGPSMTTPMFINECYAVDRQVETKDVSGCSFEINYGCPVEPELAHTLKCGTAPGNYSGVIENTAYTQNTSGVMGVCARGCDVYNHADTGDVATTLTANSGETNTAGPKVMTHAISFEPGIAKREGGHSRFIEGVGGTLRANAGDNQLAVASTNTPIPTVRRLLPVECERLMGFPDNWTRIPWKGKSAEECPDSPRYKACGNSMCVNVMRWIGERIQMVEDSMNNNEGE